MYSVVSVFTSSLVSLPLILIVTFLFSIWSIRERILYVKYKHVYFFFCINHWWHGYLLHCLCWNFCFILENILSLRSSVGHCSSFNWSIYLFLDKYKQLYCLQFLLNWSFICIHWSEGLYLVKLFCIFKHCFISPFLTFI